MLKGKSVMVMEYTKLKTLEGKNIFGKKNIIYLKVESKYREELDKLIQEYNEFTVRFNITSELHIFESGSNYIEAYFICNRVEISKFILDSLFKVEPKNKINQETQNFIDYDWSYNIRKTAEEYGIPYIKLKDDEIQLGYGNKAYKIIKESYENKDLLDIVKKVENNNKGLIPIISVTGTNGKTTTVRLIHNILLKLGYKSGLSSTGGIYIGKNIIKHGDTTGFYSAREVLQNKNIEIAVLETARGGILKKGLGYEGAKVAIITSLSEDHIGAEGVRTIDDLAKIKGIVADELSSDGVLIIKAIDILVNKYRERDNVILFEYEKNSYITEHVKNGKKAYYIENNFIVEEYKGNKTELMKVDNIPFTFNGFSKSNLKNVIVAIAATNVIHNNFDDVRNILLDIKCDINTNLGRQNILEFNKFKMIIDYGHNSEAFNEVFSIAKNFKPTKITGVITAAGDRETKYIMELGSITARYCDKIIIKEQPDLRGRNVGETASILKKGALQEGFNEEDIKVILSEEEAIKTVLEEAVEGEFIVSFSQFLYLTIPVINEFRKANGMEAIGEDLDLSH